MFRLYLRHKCKACGLEYDLRKPDGFIELISGKRHHISIGEYLFTYCPECGTKEWADERKYFWIFGPRLVYAIFLLFMSIVLVIVFYEVLKTLL